jgi:hypothetical protein
MLVVPFNCLFFLLLLVLVEQQQCLLFFFLIVGSCVATTKVLSHCWFLCGNNRDFSYCCSCVTTTMSYVETIVSFYPFGMEDDAMGHMEQGRFWNEQGW